MPNAAIWARMRAVGAEPSLFSAEELELVSRTAETGDFHLPSSPSCEIPLRAELSSPVKQIADAAQVCLDAVGPCLPVMQNTLRASAATAAGKLSRAFPVFREEIYRLLRQDEEHRDALLAAVSSCRHEERQLVCLHIAARISHRENDAAALCLALEKCEKKVLLFTAALEKLEREMEGISALCEAFIPALLDTAEPLFDPAAGRPFSPADFRAAALALRDACTQLMTDKEEM